MAVVHPRRMQAVVEAADVCPGECIFVELEEGPVAAEAL
jgi:hypothetical protein